MPSSRPVPSSCAGSRCRAAALSLLLTLPAALAPDALAQDTPKDDGSKQPGIPAPKGGGNKPGGRIRMGDGPGDPAVPPPAPPKATPQDSSQTKSEVEQWIELLSKWPSTEARQASLRLAGQPKEAFPLLVKVVEGPADDWRRVAGAAATVGRMRDVSVLPALVAKLQDRKMFTHAGEILDAIVRIDPAGAKSRLVAQLLHSATAVVEEAALRLRPRVGPHDVQDLRDVMDAAQDSAHTATRVAVVGLLSQADPAAARVTLVPAMRDPSPDVAIAAARALAADDSPETEEALRRAAVSPVDRQVAYAAVALALRGERTARRTIDEPTMKLLLGGRGLAGVDPLSRAAAAVALADLGYFHEIAALDDVLDQKIVPELITVVAGTTFWGDMRVFQPLAARRLQRLTGRSAGSAPTEWTSWWQQSGPAFRARRVLLEVPATQASSLAVSVRGTRAPGAEGTLVAASAEGLAWAMPDDLILLVSPEDAASLAAAVNGSGLLSTGDAGAGESTGGVELVVRAGRRERRLGVPGDGTSGASSAVVAEVTRLRAKYAWQRYRPSSQPGDLPSFVDRVGPLFAADRAENERAAAAADLITSSLDDARGDAWNVRALGELASLPDVGTALGDQGVLRLLQRLGRRQEIDAQAEALVAALARARRPEAHPLLLDFLTTRTSPRSRDLLVQVFRDASPASLGAGLDDARIPVRAAALASLGEKSPTDLADAAVRKAMADPDVTLRREAVRALGRLRCEWAREDVEKLAMQSGDLRAAAVEALGRLGGKRALGPLMSAFASDDIDLRVTAVEALGATKEPGAISALAYAMSLDPAAMVREVAARAIESFGTERASAELRRVAMDRAQSPGPRARAVGGLVVLAGREATRDLARLVDDPADEVADEAALALAKWREADAVPRLLRMLAAGRSLRYVRTALEGVSLESFPQEDADTLSALYSGWWETSRERGARGWLVDALVLTGIDDPVLRDWEAGRIGRDVAPFLIRGMRTPRWCVRRACDLALREIGQRTFGDIEPWTAGTDVERIAESWEEWWAAQSGDAGTPR